MGFTPAQVGEMSLWQFMACADGWAMANSPEAGKRSNDVGSDDLWDMIDAAPEFLH